MNSSVIISGIIGLPFPCGTEVIFLLKIGLRVGNVPSISQGKIGGREVIGLSGWPEHNPGYADEQEVPSGHAEHAAPTLYISDRNKLPPNP